MKTATKKTAKRDQPAIANIEPQAAPAVEQTAVETKPAKGSKKKAKPATEQPAAAAPTDQPAAESTEKTYRDGSKRAKVVAALSATPQTMTQLMAAAGVDKTHYNLINALIKAGKVKKVEGGYVLA